MTRLWQRNVIGACVSAAALGVIVATGLWPDWSTYRASVTPEHVVAAGRSGAVDGQTWQVTSIRHLASGPAAGSRRPPDGTVLTVVSIDRTGSGDDLGCVGMITDGNQRWKAEGPGGFGVPPPAGTTSVCSGSGPVQFSFLLPGDVVPTAVDITDPQGPIRVRLLL